LLLVCGFVLSIPSRTIREWKGFKIRWVPWSLGGDHFVTEFRQRGCFQSIARRAARYVWPDILRKCLGEIYRSQPRPLGKDFSHGADAALLDCVDEFVLLKETVAADFVAGYQPFLDVFMEAPQREP
jgi:hypothetical protein